MKEVTAWCARFMKQHRVPSNLAESRAQRQPRRHPRPACKAWKTYGVFHSRVPSTVAAHISLMATHLGGRAYSLRSAIVTAIGQLIMRAFPAGPGDDADAQGAQMTCNAAGPACDCCMFHCSNCRRNACMREAGSCTLGPNCMLAQKHCLKDLLDGMQHP